MPVYTFVGTKLKEDWDLNEIRVKDVNGVEHTLERGDSADLFADDVRNLGYRFKLVAGAGQPPDPIVDPDQGPAGTAGAAGPAGVTWRNAWSAATAYAQRDGVTWAGSSYVALNAVAAGGTPPAGDAVNWLKIAQGGGDIAYAENVTNALLNPLTPANTDVDVPGLSIVVPANSGAHWVEARIPLVVLQINASAVAGEMCQIHLYVVDEGGVCVADAPWEVVIPSTTSGKNPWTTLLARRRLPNNATQKTYKAQGYVNTLNSGHQSVLFFAGPGNETTAQNRTNFDFTPAYIRAHAA